MRTFDSEGFNVMYGISN